MQRNSRKISFLPAALVLLTFVAIDCARAQSQAAAPPSGPANTVPEFVLNDAAGENHSRAEWLGSKAIVLLFLGPECPVSNGYAPEMQRLATKYTALGVAWYGVQCDADLTAAEADSHAKEYGLKFPVLLDPAQRLAQATGAKVTPEAVVLSPGGAVLYRGRIDDRYSTDGKRRDEPTVDDLEDALRLVLAGKPPVVAETKAFGCPLPRIRQSPR